MPDETAEYCAMGKMHAEGVTLIELMVALTVLAVVLVAGVPSFIDFLANNRMSGAANDFVTSLHQARSEAIKRRTSVAICARGDLADACGQFNGLAKGWLVFVDDDANGILGDDDVIIGRHAPLEGRITDRRMWLDEEGRPTPRLLLVYTPDGYLAEDVGGNAPTAHLQLCDGRGGRQTFGGVAAGRWIHISPTGRPSVQANYEVVENPQVNPLGGCG